MFRKITVIIFSLVLLFSLTACDGGGDDELTPYDVTFRVDDSNSDVVENAEVVLEGESKNTDSDGSVDFYDLTGESSYTISKTGYLNANGVVTSDDSGSDIFVTLEFLNENGPTVESAVTSQTAATADLSQLGVNLSTVIKLENGLTNKFNGAYGNSIGYTIITGNASSSEVVAGFYSEEGVGEYLAINIKYSSLQTDIPTVSQLESAIEGVDGFTIKSSGEGDDLLDIYDEGYIEGSFTGGEDAITVTFSEDLLDSTVDDLNTDFNFETASSVNDTSYAESSNGVISVTVGNSDAQLLGDKIGVNVDELEDVDNNSAATNAVTITE